MAEDQYAHPPMTQYGYPTQHVGYYAAPPAEPHSVLGIVSFIIALAMLAGVMALIAVAGYMEASTPGGMSEEAPATILLGLLYIFTLLITLVGAILGLAGVLRSGRRRVFAVLGLVFNGLVLLLGVGLMVLGMMME